MTDLSVHAETDDDRRRVINTMLDVMVENGMKYGEDFTIEVTDIPDDQVEAFKADPEAWLASRNA